MPGNAAIRNAISSGGTFPQLLLNAGEYHINVKLTAHPVRRGYPVAIEVHQLACYAAAIALQRRFNPCNAET